MEPYDYEQIMAKSVNMTCTQITDKELNSLYMAALLGSNPKRVNGYDKVAELFTEDDGTRMHDTTFEAFRVVWENRCGKKGKNA